jgi:predicted alpha/beta superfamily hydrolase
LHTRTGNFRLHEKFHSRHLPEDRNIIVYLPPGYEDDQDRRYPVLYLHDGQNVFDSETAFGGNEWHADEVAEGMIRAGAIEPLIMVGIYNAGERRIDEYTPCTGVRDHRETGGLAINYAAMLVDELKAFIDEEYRTFNTPECTGMGGSSLGGLLTLFIGLRHPEIFGKLAVLSPSVWWCNRFILRALEEHPVEEPRPKIWLDIGTAEGDRTVQEVRQLRDLLIAQGWAESSNLAYFEDADAPHSESAWAARLPNVLEFLFGQGGD